MKRLNLLSDIKRQRILIELEIKPLKFVEFKKILVLKSNILSYNIKILIKEGFVNKEGLYYYLTDKAKDLMPYIRNLNIASQVPFPCVAVIVRENGKILIRKKPTEPEKGKRIFIGGRISFGEDIFKAAKRHVKEKVGIDIKNLKIICVNNYTSKKGKINVHFVVFFITAEPEKGIPINSKWEDPTKIRGKMFPDNKFIIKEMLNNRRVKIINSVYDEDSDKFKVVNIS